MCNVAHPVLFVPLGFTHHGWKSSRQLPSHIASPFLARCCLSFCGRVHRLVGKNFGFWLLTASLYQGASVLVEVLWWESESCCLSTHPWIGHVVCLGRYGKCRRRENRRTWSGWFPRVEPTQILCYHVLYPWPMVYFKFESCKSNIHRVSWPVNVCFVTKYSKVEWLTWNANFWLSR